MITSCLHNPFSSLFEDPSKVAIVSRFVTISLTVQSHAGELVITYTVTNTSTIHMRECRSSEFEIPVRTSVHKRIYRNYTSVNPYNFLVIPRIYAGANPYDFLAAPSISKWSTNGIDPAGYCFRRTNTLSVLVSVIPASKYQKSFLEL